ncbi:MULTISPECIES: C-GCAxxG-C-C family protein [unclassified Ruminococcus]|uniref:C-GCAxxG-C-C family protein n=1 Tax=unclassified Ruminococcus TaxID=2608920 RepID=UPI00210E78FC|nr:MULTISPECIES: C-GCAxxG-C-C family protein [unclassified Ruminococcus]MCQ4022195.1 hypothetical protein [Ruminococcus sp. zg-924]MCQ4115242.1 hypothetical protein [Ruminococcus sp. zg-921]
MTKAEQAKQLFMEGYNCSQAVFIAFADECGIDKETAALISSGFGGGLGRMREVCGAVIGMSMAASMLFGYSDPKNFEKKKELYGIIQELAGEYRKNNGSIICREILGLDKNAPTLPTPDKRTEQYYKKRPCPLLVYNAAEILDGYIAKNKA